MNRSMNRVGFAAALVITFTLLSSAPADAQADGATLFKTKCAACHSADGSGSGPVGKQLNIPDLGSPAVQKETDAQLIDATTNGKGKMPAYKGKLTDDQVRQLVSFIRTLAKKS